MKNYLKKIKILLALLLMSFFSCEKDLSEDNKNEYIKTKERPNLKLNFIKTKDNPKSIEPLLRKYSKKIKHKPNPNERGTVLQTLEGDFGIVKLDQVLELNEGTYTTETFEVEEAISNPNIYYNLIIDKSENIWLYKIEKLTQPIDSFPINSELVTRMQLDSNLNMSTPCDSIIYPPFGYVSSEIIPNTGGGGAIPGGWYDNPPPSDTSGGFGTGGFFNNGSGPANTGGGGSGGSGVVEIIEAIGDAFVGAWNWLIDLFTGNPKPGENKPCNCQHRGAVVIDDTTTPCGDLGYIAVIPQDEYVDKIINFQNFFTVLHNNDNIFLYENHEVVDYIDNLLTLYPNNFELHNLFPQVISAVRLNKITWNDAQNFILQSQIDDGLNLDINYSSKSPFFIDMNSVSGNTPEEIKFREVYNSLMQSPKFKELFYDLFNNTPLFNVKFTIENIPQQFGPNYTSGKCKLIYLNGHTDLFNNIIIDRNFILTNSKSKIATTIIHECIHAYLNIKLRNPNIGMPINNINNLDFQDCINEFYANFTGMQTQHSFFVDYMIPTMVEILNDVKNDIFTVQQISAVEFPASNALIYDVSQTIPSVKNYNVILPWNWTDYFTHLCYSGLESTSSYQVIYPQGSPNELNNLQYISIATFIFN